MRPENKIINGLWIGEHLSAIEMLTLHSFTAKGHIFHLWAYNDFKNELPKNVILKDANIIIPEDKIFRKKKADPIIGNGKGGLTLFADIFRCKLLYEVGGWWVDMDILCLKALDFSEEYFFRSHPYLPTINNIMKVPKGSELMKRSYEDSNANTNADTEKYLLPNEILNEHISDLELSKYIQDGLCNREWFPDIEYFLFTSKKISEDWYFLHWINEEWRTQGLDKNSFYNGTIIYDIMKKYKVEIKTLNPDKRYHLWHLKKNKLVQVLKPILKKTPLFSLYKKFEGSK